MRLTHILPLVLFAVVALALGIGLTLNPRIIPSALIDKPIPEFTLPPVDGRPNGLAASDLRTGEVAIVNIFASWCGPCRVEHPLLMEIARSGEVPVHGINYKDLPRNAVAWLKQYGDPYQRVGSDRDGHVSIDWGVYGVPETFVIDREGRIAYKHVGPIMRDDLDNKILKKVRELQGK
jgi:cytochrome c biogenesis protein CcmG/thiol:disulfide interchange protein DsbE